jgi:protein-S-isoprenylcysteine O-methyltransferase Ste14
MSFQEKSTWIYAVISVIVPGVYFATVIGQLQNTAVTEIAYQGTMLATIGLGIALAIIGHIAVAMSSPKDADKSDERDTNINRYGEYVGSFVLYGGMLGALGLALAESEQFWIANAIYSTFILAALATSTVKIVAYRRGF